VSDVARYRSPVICREHYSCQPVADRLVLLHSLTRCSCYLQRKAGGDRRVQELETAMLKETGRNE
jgi:hypothetical protein